MKVKVLFLVLNNRLFIFKVLPILKTLLWKDSDAKSQYFSS